MIIINECFGRKDEFEVVNKIPGGYVIWNIGDNMNDGYLPVAIVRDNMVVPSSLKAIAINNEADLKILRKAAGYGISTLRKAKKAVHISPTTAYLRIKKDYAQKALPILERITENEKN